MICVPFNRYMSLGSWKYSGQCNRHAFACWINILMGVVPITNEWGTTWEQLIWNRGTKYGRKKILPDPLIRSLPGMHQKVESVDITTFSLAQIWAKFLSRFFPFSPLPFFSRKCPEVIPFPESCWSFFIYPCWTLLRWNKPLSLDLFSRDWITEGDV